MKKHLYKIAGFILVVNSPDGWNLEALLPSFKSFRFDGQETPYCLFRCDILPTEKASFNEVSDTLLEETINDMGIIRLYEHSRQYLITLNSGNNDNLWHSMLADRTFSTLNIYLRADAPEIGHALSSLLRVAYSQAVLHHNAVAIHASTVVHEKTAYLFMGKSGTGKSTHSRLWIEHIPGTELLNDDNPTLRILDDRAYAFGTPWSGKTPCYKPWFFPLGGMVRLRQAPDNRFCLQDGGDAFVAIYPGCSVISKDPELRNRLYDTVAHLADLVPVGILDCRPDREAALLCRESLHKAQQRI